MRRPQTLTPDEIDLVTELARGAARRLRLDPDDAQQIALIAALQAKREYDRKRNVPMTGWIRQKAWWALQETQRAESRQLFGRTRHAARMAPLPAPAPARQAVATVDAHADPAYFDNAAQIGEVLGALEALPRRQAEVVSLRYFAHLEYQEIGRMLQIDYQLAAREARNGVARLREMLRKVRQED